MNLGDFIEADAEMRKLLWQLIVSWPKEWGICLLQLPPLLDLSFFITLQSV
jgi:hypothetical protein